MAGCSPSYPATLSSTRATLIVRPNPSRFISTVQTAPMAATRSRLRIGSIPTAPSRDATWVEKTTRSRLWTCACPESFTRANSRSNPCWRSSTCSTPETFAAPRSPTSSSTSTVRSRVVPVTPCRFSSGFGRDSETSSITTLPYQVRDSARTAVVHRHRAVAERLRREQLELARAGQRTLVQRRAVAGDPGMDEQLVLVDQVQPVELGRELAAAEEHPGRCRVLELLYALAQIAGDVVAVGPREVLARRRHHVLGLGLQLDRPLAHGRRRLLVAAGDGRPVALHHLVGDATPQHRPALVHETGEEGVRLVVGDPLLVVDATVQGEVEAEGEESHGRRV